MRLDFLPKSINALVSGSLYYACRLVKIPITLQIISDESKEDFRKISRAFTLLIRELKLKISSLDPITLVSRYITKLGLDVKIEKKVRDFFQNLSTKLVSGKDPKGICAGVIYLVCKDNNMRITQKEISNVVGLTEATIRNRYHELKIVKE